LFRAVDQVAQWEDDVYELNFTPVFESFDMLLAGAWVTVWMSCIAMILGLIVAVLGATLKTSGNRFARIVVGVYVEAIRNTPFLVQLYFIFFALPAIGVRFDPNEAALLALVVNFGAYGTEIVRAGIESIGKGQVEAAMAIGMSRLQVLRHVVLKPALRTIYPEPPPVCRRLQSKYGWSLWIKVTEQTGFRPRSAPARFG
jgi:polar amino acid transport system permease protein